MSNISYGPADRFQHHGAYDSGTWETKVIDLATGAGTLKRGTVISLDVGGKGAIAGYW